MNFSCFQLVCLVMGRGTVLNPRQFYLRIRHNRGRIQRTTNSGRIVNPSDVVKIASGFSNFQKYAIASVRGLANFVYPPPSTSDFEILLQDVSNDLEDGEVPDDVVSERLCLILRDILRLHEKTPGFNFQEASKNVIQGLKTLSNNSIIFWRNSAFYTKSLKEVWICCEPCLEIVVDEGGGLRQLKSQLPYVDKVVYLMTTKKYFEELQDWVRGDPSLGPYLSKLELRIVDRVTQRPAVIFQTRAGDCFGMVGTSHPQCKVVESRYVLQKPLPMDWVRMLSPKEVESYKEQFIELMKK